VREKTNGCSSGPGVEALIPGHLTANHSMAPLYFSKNVLAAMFKKPERSRVLHKAALFPPNTIIPEQVTGNIRSFLSHPDAWNSPEPLILLCKYLVL
jgi:hypothetical protein